MLTGRRHQTPAHDVTVLHLPADLVASILSSACISAPEQLLVGPAVRQAVLGGKRGLRMTLDCGSLARLHNARHSLSRLPERRIGGVKLELNGAEDDKAQLDNNDEAVAALLSTRCPVVTSLHLQRLHQVPPACLISLHLSMPCLKMFILTGNRNLTQLCFPAGLPNLASVSARECSALTHLDVSALTKLKQLECFFTSRLTSLDISGCTTLTELTLFYTALSQLPLQPQHSQLLVLKLYGNRFTSVDLTHHTALDWLNLHEDDCTHLQLPAACQLDELNLNSLRLLTPLTLARLTQLYTLVLDVTCNEQLDNSILERLPQLHHLRLLCCNTRFNWAPKLPQLEFLELARCMVIGVLDLRGAPSLTHLSVKGCYYLSSLIVPPSLQQLRCARLKSLDHIDLSAARGLKASFKRCLAPTQLKCTRATVCVEDAVANTEDSWEYMGGPDPSFENFSDDDLEQEAWDEEKEAWEEEEEV
jgi:hypothetical protein